MWPCSYDHRELDTGWGAGATKVAPYAGPTAAAASDAAKLKDQELIFNNSIFCTRSLFLIHIARRVHFLTFAVYRFPFTVNGKLTTVNECVRRKNMVKPHDLLVPVS